LIPNLISAMGDEVALFSVARQKGISATSAVGTSRAFGRGCAALTRSQASKVCPANLPLA
jgi:hypothetical protein